MKIDYTARRIRLHPAVRPVVERRMAKLEKVLPRDAQAHVVVFAEKKGTTVEVTVVAGQHTWTATATAPDQQAAAQAALLRIEAQAMKAKAKVKEKSKKRSTAPARPLDRAEPRAVELRRQVAQARPMFEEDALAAFAGGAADVMAYRDLGDADALRVLYRRSDGGLGLLIPN